jgi:alanine racemase
VSRAEISRALATVDLGAIRRNCGRLPSPLCAVVKADAYGHGVAQAAAAALDGGASWLAVATAGEAADLRALGLEAPLLVMGALTADELRVATEANADVVAWTDEVADSAPRVHVKLDTGMGRLGTKDRDAALRLAARDNVVGLMTHFATADETEGENAAFMGEQLLRFRAAAAPLRPRFPGAALHAANSAATFREPATAFDMVRCGIALYGCSPFGADPADLDLRPAMSLVSYLAATKILLSRESVGYGRSWRAARGTRVAVVPVGYADGYSRALSGRAEILTGGRRVPVIGTISMDQLTVDLGPDGAEPVGEEAVLMGTQGAERITAEELAALRGTINYEVVCAVGARVPRVHEG